MEITIKLEFNQEQTRNIYSGLTYDGDYDVVFNETEELICEFIIENGGITDDFIFIKINCNNCNDQIYKIKIKT